MTNSVGDRGLEHYALCLEAGEVDTYDLARLEHHSCTKINAPAARGQMQAVSDGEGRASGSNAATGRKPLNLTTGRKPLNLTLIALKSDTIFAVASYQIDGDQMNYMRPSGLTSSVSVSEVDWRKTWQLNADRGASRRYKAH